MAEEQTALPEFWHPEMGFLGISLVLSYVLSENPATA
jgi:hypothetical protein